MAVNLAAWKVGLLVDYLVVVSVDLSAVWSVAALVAQMEQRMVD